MAGIAGASDGGLDWSQRSTTEQPMKRATYEDVLNAPENKVAEILDGELFLSPRPAPRHAAAASSLGGRVGGPFDGGIGGPGGWWILDEPELHFGEHVLVPDLAGWRRERMPAIPDVAFFTLAPDWVCEVLSPSTARIDRGEKLPIYARGRRRARLARRPGRADARGAAAPRRGVDDRWRLRRHRGRAARSVRSNRGCAGALWGDPVAPASAPEDGQT